MRRFTVLTGLTAASTAAALAFGPTAVAHDDEEPTVSDPLASGLVGPLQMDVGKGGIYVSQSFAGLLTKVRPDGTTKQLVSEPGEVDGVAVRGWHAAYTYSQADAETGMYTTAQLKMRKPNGKTFVIADLLKFEDRRNPDSHQEYGFLDLTPECAEQVPPEIGGEPYQGIVDSHPYAIANAPGGGWYVADAAANTILKVSKRGRTKVVYVAPPQEVTITADMAAALGLPECVAGSTHAFEAVPTDVEVSRSGHLYVTLLPGGPESPVLGARGSVVKVNPWKGKGREVASGLLSATNLALGHHGKIYVTELFGNRISVVKRGQVRPLVELPSPAAVEYVRGKLLATTDVLAETGGSIVKVSP